MSKVLVENNADGTTLVTINRPERRNAICAETALLLQKAFTEFERSPTQKAAVLTGAGNEAFSGGADTGNFPELWRCIPTVGFETTKPIISAVGGWCVGGALVVSMMCDLTVAAENARFSYPEARMGFTGGMIAGLAARIPHKIAMEMILGITLIKDDPDAKGTGSIVPLAFPIIAGAGTLSTILSLRAVYQEWNILIGITLNLVIVYIVLRGSMWLERKIGKPGFAVLRRVFGVILLAIAVKIVKNNFTGS